jgi:hypothetical protein
MTGITHLPNEILSMIFHISTSDATSVKARFKDPIELATYRSTENEHRHENLQVKLVISLVCKRWNAVSAPFLCEYIPRVDFTRLQSLVTYLEKEDEEVGKKRGRWTRRLDVDFHSFERDWDEYQETNGARPKVIDSWDYIISPDLTPNITVLDVSSKRGGLVKGHTMYFFQVISRLENLRRVEWRVGGTNLSALRELSIQCPKLEHVAFQLLGTHVDENLPISFPHVESMVLELTSIISPGLLASQPWNLPKLHYFGFHPLYQDSCNGFIQVILSSSKEHIKSLDLVEYGTDISSLVDLVCSFPNLETLYFDPSRFFFSDPSSLSFSRRVPLVSLRTLGWRTKGRRGSWNEMEELLSKQVPGRLFPNISTLLSLEDLESRVRPAAMDAEE